MKTGPVNTNCGALGDGLIMLGAPFDGDWGGREGGAD